MDAMLTKISKFQRRMKTIFDPFEGKRPRVLILGLDGAGKTTLLYRAKLDNSIYANVPPKGINIEHMTPRRGANMQMYDMTGNKMARLMWKQWYRSTEAVVFVVDSADKVRVDEAKFELHHLLISRDLRRVPLMVVANKQDLEDTLSTEDVKRELDLDSITDRDWAIYGTSATTGTGISRVFKDTVDKIKAYRHFKAGLQMQPDSRRSSKSVKSEKTEETKSVSNCSSIEEPVKVKSLFDSINETNTEEHCKDDVKVDEDVSEHTSERNSDANAKYDQMYLNNEGAEVEKALVNDTATVSVNADESAISTDIDDNAGDIEGEENKSESSREEDQRTEKELKEAYRNKTPTFSAVTVSEGSSDEEGIENLV